MNILGIGQAKRETPTSDCPSCGAKADKRIDGGGFGTAKLTLCGVCGHEFQER